MKQLIASISLFIIISIISYAQNADVTYYEDAKTKKVSVTITSDYSLAKYVGDYSGKKFRFTHQPMNANTGKYDNATTDASVDNKSDGLYHAIGFKDMYIELYPDAKEKINEAFRKFFKFYGRKPKF